MKYFFLALFILAISYYTVYSQQTGSVTGITTDANDGKLLKGATVLLRTAMGKALGGAISDGRGYFHLGNIAVGHYELVIRFIGYDSLLKNISISTNDTLRLGRLALKRGELLTKGIEVTDKALRVEVKGDTSEYNAQQFKTDKNAAAEDMIRKMPGIEVDQNGQVKAQGEQVRKVLVDGKPFFGGDPSAVLKNLPSEVIDKIQVFDQMSDQAAFTKFDDGDRTKTLNIVMRQDRKRGQFGKLYAGYGTNDRYSLGGNVNIFDGDRRISFIGMSNNINQQNFSIQDILGVIGGGGNPMYQRMGMMMQAFGGNTPWRGGGRPGGSGHGSGGGSSVSDFLVQPSDGITSAHSFGLNYTDNFYKNLSLSGSYFVNKTDNESNQSINGVMLLGSNTSQTTEQNTLANTGNINHRFNLRIDYAADSLNSFLLTPNLTFQSYDKSSASVNTTHSSENTLLNTSDTRSSSATKGLNFSNDLLYRRRFLTEGRTFSINFRTAYNTNNGSSNTIADNSFLLQNLMQLDTLLQKAPSNGLGLTLGANASYTEQVFANSIIQLSYNVNYNRNTAEKKTYWPDSISSRFDQLQSNLSNASESHYITHRPGLTFKYNFNQTTNLSVGADYQIADLNIAQTFPQNFDAKRTFYNVLPSIMFSMRPNMASNIWFSYRTSTNQPSISQLQNVVDNSDPLRLSSGNPHLQQEFTHSIFANYRTFDMATASAFFVMVSANYTENKITTSTIIASQDTTLEGYIRLGNGAQYSHPINLNGYLTANTFATYSYPIEPFESFKLNLIMNGGAMFSSTPTLVNNKENVADNLVLSPSFAITSNVSENMDFSLSWRTAYTIAKNSLRTELDENYYTHTLYARLNWVFGGGFVLSGDMSYIINGGLSGGYNQTIPLISGGFGYRFLDEDAEVKLSVFDILKQNQSISRNITGTYIEDTRTNVLQRYGLLTFTYNLRRFGQ